ncbi:uncharacterized protein METZ01_LOCUS157424, partial [marine metagenome]
VPKFFLQVISQIFGVAVMAPSKNRPVSRQKEYLKSFQYSGKNS